MGCVMKYDVTKKYILQFALPFFMLVILSSCSSVVTKNETISSGIIDADDPYIQYIGRFDFTNPKQPVYDWAGVRMCAKFEGTSCSVRLNDNVNEYAVIIDNYAPKLLHPDTAKVYKVASGLADSVPHTIILQKRTESLVGKGEFLGFVLDKGRMLVKPDKRPDRRIEFIGNSITSAYGIEGDSVTCHFSPETENANMSYAAITSRALNADYSLVSYSGRGVVRNYGDSLKESVDPMPALYDRTCFWNPTLKWDFTKWVPQAVVINLGTNDFTTMPYPDKDVFQNAYRKLIERVRAQYPNVMMFCVCGPMAVGPTLSYIKEVVAGQQKLRSRDKDVFLVEVDRSNLKDSDWGCDYHPNITGANKIADILISAIRLRMNW
jgi:hypothetical protein